MSYYTTIKVVNKDGKAVKSHVSCAGQTGYTDSVTGEISFELSSNTFYDVYAKRYGATVSGKVQGGKEITLREK